MKKILWFIEKHEALLVILCVVALLRLPGLFEPNRYADEDIYLTIGQGLARGLVLYRDIFDNKTPLIYLVAMVAGNVMRFRFMLMVWNLVNVVLIWRLAEKLVGKKWGVVLATVLFSLFSTIPLLEGEIANGEIFMIMPATAGVLLLLTGDGQITKRRAAFFWSGILFAMAFLFKVPVAVEFFGISLFLVFFQKIVDSRLWLLLAGFGLPIVISLVYFNAVGVGDIYVRSALLQNIAYLSSWGGSKASILSGGLMTRAVILGLALLLIWLNRKKFSLGFGLALVWLVTALFGSLLSGRPYPHYLLEIVGPAALLVALFLTQISIYTSIFTLGLTLLVVGAVVRYNFWYYRSLPYYQNFLEYILGRKTREQHDGFWGDEVSTNNEVAGYIRKVTNSGDKIFIWGTRPAIYTLAKRLPVGKYTVAYHVLDFSAKEEIANQLIKEQPKIIGVVANEVEFSQLSGMLASNYVLVKVVGGVEIYLRLNKT